MAEQYTTIKRLIKRILLEQIRKKVKEKGAIVYKLKCPAGEKIVGGKCVKIDDKEKFDKKIRKRQTTAKSKNKQGFDEREDQIDKKNAIRMGLEKPKKKKKEKKRSLKNKII